MPSGPAWWFNKVNLRETFKSTITTTKHGEHTRYFIQGKGRVTQSEFNKQYGGALWQNQVRGFAMKMGIKDWNVAQSKFSQLRKDYLKGVKEAQKEKQDKTGNKDDTLSREEQEAIWEQYAYN